MRHTVVYLFIFSFLVFSCDPTRETTQSATKLTEKGVSLALAKFRRENLADITYDLFFNIPENRSDSIPATLILTFSQENPEQPLILDFKEAAGNLRSIRIAGKKIPYDFSNEHITIESDYLEKGINTLELDFTAGDLSLNRNEEFLYTLLVPDRARTLFPVFDQPDLKATFELTLEVPESWETVANGAITDHTIAGGRKTVTFAPVTSLSTYLFAFAAGDFGELRDGQSEMVMYYRETDSARVLQNAPEIFRLHRASLAYLEEYTGINYPFGKFDFVLLPPFQYGGMEHPGSVFYRESALFLDKDASINRKLRRASLIAHETAHMWFGNLVTMEWFNDVWLKEVFANQMASKIVNPSFPETDHELNFLLSYYPGAMETDRSAGTHPIQQELDNLASAGTLYGNIIYQKAPIVMRNLEEILGEEAFRKALQEYLTTYSYGNATWDNLVAIMNKYTDRNLTVWNRDWVKGRGIPAYAITQGNDSTFITLLNGEKGQVWPQQINLAWGEKPEKGLFLERPQAALPGKGLSKAYSRAYGYFKVSPESWEKDRTSLIASQDSKIRAAFWLNTWEAMLAGDLAPVTVLAALKQAVKREDNPLLLSRQLSYLHTIYWQFLSKTEKVAATPDVESLVYGRLMNSKDPSLRRLLYGSLVTLSQTGEGTARLRKIWETGGDEINLELSENEMINLVSRLCLLEAEGAEEMYREQLRAVKNKDRQERMKFVEPALAAKPEVRSRFFHSLKDPEERASEPWVVEALGYLHHPLRQELSQTFVQESLEILPEIQETGDIFFPARWLNATLSQYADPAVAETVRQYLDTHPDLSPKLRNKVLQAADRLFRAASLQEKTREPVK